MKSCFVAVLCAASVISGCSTHNTTFGNASLASETQAGAQGKIEIGKTTKNEVRRMYGSPVGTDFREGGEEVWRYRHLSGEVRGATYVPIYGMFKGGVDRRAKELVISFDGAGVVKGFTFNDSTELMSTDDARKETKGLPTAK